MRWLNEISTFLTASTPAAGCQSLRLLLLTCGENFLAVEKFVFVASKGELSMLHIAIVTAFLKLAVQRLLHHDARALLA